MHDRIRLKLV
jgi:hypothetical protein